MKFLTFLSILLLPLAASAQSWLANCRSGDTTTSVTSHKFVCFDRTANTDDSPILSVGVCGYTNWEYFEDKDGDGTECTVSFTIQTCPAGLTGSAADNGCEDVEIPSGSPTLSSANRQQAGIAVGARGLRAQAGGTGSNASDCRILVSCASGAGGL